MPPLPAHGSEIRTVPRPVFRQPDAFARRLREEMDAQFGARLTHADPRLARKAAAIALWFVASYCAMLFLDDLLIKFLASLLLGLAGAAVGFAIFHDASHGTLASSASTNSAVAVLCCIALGPSRLFWNRKHLVLHHGYPNIDQWDDDLESRGWLRVSPHQPWRRRYRGQQWMLLPLYTLNGLEWFFVKDFVQYARRAVNPYQPVAPLRTADHIEFWLCKLAYLLLFVALPFATMPWEHAVVCLALFHAMLSLTLTLVFQVAHLNEDVEFCEPGAHDWSEHQLRTTANFATRNSLVTWFTGGLNHQIEHHLFAGTSPTLYGEMAPHVRALAVEFGLPYVDHSSFADALRSHFALIARLSRDPGASDQRPSATVGGSSASLLATVSSASSTPDARSRAI